MINPSQPLEPMPRSARLELSYLHGGVALYRPGESLAPRILRDYEFVLLQEGRAMYRADGRDYPLAPGSAVLARPGFQEIYEWDKSGRTRHAYFHFGIESIPSGWPEPATWPISRRETSAVVQNLCGEILDLSHRRQSLSASPPGQMDAVLVEALILLFLNPSKTAPTEGGVERPEPVQRALKWMRQIIDENPGRAVELSDLAVAGGVTSKHLCRVFSDSIGHSPMETYRLLRLQLAVALLARSNLQVQDIARRCGFDDPLYFSRCFTKAFGLSPRATRERMLLGNPPPGNPLPADLMPRLRW